MNTIFIYAGLKLIDYNYIIHQGNLVLNRQIYLYDRKKKIYRGHLYSYSYQTMSVREVYYLSLEADMYHIVAPADDCITVELELEPAIDIDLFDCYGNMLVNRQYYTRSGDTVKGPFVIEQNRNHQKFKEAMANDLIYVPKKEQKEFKNVKL